MVKARKKTKKIVKGKAVKGNMAKFISELKKIIDPHTGINIVDMRLAKNIKENGNLVSVDFVPTTPFCPVINFFVESIHAAARKAGYSESRVLVKD